MKLHAALSIIITAALLACCISADAKSTRYRGAVSRKSSQQEGFLTKVLSVPVRSAGAVVGVAFGVPVHVGKSIVSDSRSTSSSLTKGSLNGTPSPFKSALGTAVGVPVGIVTGTVKGSVQGTGQGLTDGYNKPFSSQSVGLK